jgi:23S rRNA (uridine2552-2'-O)-methyltransferase
VTYDRKDSYYKKAKTEGFAARAVYKLEELDLEFKLLKPGDHVLDLGCAPGSWLQYAERKVGMKGRVVGIDLLPLRLSFPPHVTVLQGDAFKTPPEELQAQGGGEPRPFDVVLSDMAPNTTGIKSVDQDRSLALCERALEVARTTLRPGGKLALKIFEGGEMQAFVASCKTLFDEVKIKRPKGTRAGSKETYVICRGRKRA